MSRRAGVVADGLGVGHVKRTTYFGTGDAVTTARATAARRAHGRQPLSILQELPAT